MNLYIYALLDKIDKHSRRGHKEYNIYPIEAVTIFDNIIKNVLSKKLKSKKQNDEYVYEDLYPSEVFPLFLPTERLIYLIFHLNCKFNINVNAKLRYNNTMDDDRYVKYTYLFSENMSRYNYLDIFLELLKTISTKAYFKRLLYFGLTFFKCLDTITYLSLKFFDDIIFGKKKKYEDLKKKIEDLMKDKSKNSDFNVLYTNIKNIGARFSNFDNRYPKFYKLYYSDSIPQSLNVCITLYHFFFKDNTELKDIIDRYNNTSRDNLKSDKFILDKYDDVLNILLFYYTTDIKKNNYASQKEKVVKIYEGYNTLYLLKSFIDNYLFLQNNMIESVIQQSGKDNDVFFKDPFSVIYNHNFYFKNTFASFLWNTTALFNDRDVFNRVYALVDSTYSYPKNPSKTLSKSYNVSGVLEMDSFVTMSRRLIYNFDIYKHKYNRLIPYLYLSFTNKYMKKKGVGFQISRLPYIKSSFTMAKAANLKRTILGSWNIIPYRYNTLTTKPDKITKKIFSEPVYTSMSFISTCNDVWSYTSKKKIKGSSSTRHKLKRPPSYCNEMHIFSYNGDTDINKDTFKKEKRKYPRIFLKKTFVDIFKVNIMKEDLYGKSSRSFLDTLFYYDVSIKLNIGDNPTSAPLFFKNIKRVYKKKNQQDLRQACLCKGFDKYDYLKFFKIEGGIIYLYENFYKLLLETFSLDKKKSNQSTNSEGNPNLKSTKKENNNKPTSTNVGTSTSENKKLTNKEARLANVKQQNDITQNIHKLYEGNQSGGDNNKNSKNSKTKTNNMNINHSHNNSNHGNSNNNSNHINGNNNNGNNNGNECSDKIRSLSVNTEDDYFNNNILPFMYMKYESKGKIQKLSVNYHPRHTQENIAVIIAEPDPDEKEYGDKKRLNVIINPDIGQYTMNYFIIMIIANLFWYCVSYRLSSDSFKKMFSVKKEKVEEFDKSSAVFSRFDKIRLIDSKMNRILDYIFKQINTHD